MQAGDRVTIYQDVLTKMTPEGEAVLVEQMKKDGDWPRSEYWRVRFVGDEPEDVYDRWIKP